MQPAYRIFNGLLIMKKISDATPVKTFYRTSLTSIAGDVGADIASRCDTVYGYASLASSCYGGIVSFKSVVSSTKWILVPARTVKVPVIEEHFIRFTFELRASYWKLSTGAESVKGTFELVVTGAGYIASPEPDSQLPDNMTPAE